MSLESLTDELATKQAEKDALLQEAAAVGEECRPLIAAVVQAEKDYRETEYLALKEDPEFLELKAMDRLNLHRPGDKVYRVKRDER